MMNDNSNNRMSQQTMSQNQWYPPMNPYQFYGMNQYGYGSFGAPGPFFPPNGYYPSQMPSHMMNQQSPPNQMKGFVSGGQLESTSSAKKEEPTETKKDKLGESNAESKPGEQGGCNKMDIDLPPLPPGPAPPPFANFAHSPGLLPSPNYPPNLMNMNTPPRFNNFIRSPFNNNQQQQQQQMNFNGVDMTGLSKKQRAKLRKRLTQQQNGQQASQANGSGPQSQNRIQPPLPPGPPPPPGNAPPPPMLGGNKGGPVQGTAQHFPSSTPQPEAKQTNYKNILNSSLMGDWPDSLRSYISRALSRCKTESDEQRVTKQLQNKIAAAANSNMLYIKDWNVEPLPLMENELSNVTIKPFQFNKNSPGLLPSPFQPNKPSSTLKQRLGAMNQQSSPYNNNNNNSNSNQKSPYNNNQQQNKSGASSSAESKKYGKSSDWYGRKRRSSSSSSSSSSQESDSEAADYIPLSNKSKNKKTKNNESNGSNSRSYKKNKNKNNNSYKAPRFCHSSDAFSSPLDTDEALLRKRAARFIEPASTRPRSSHNNSFSVRFDTLDVNQWRGGGDDEFDLSSCHVVGTCREVEKQFFRLTAAPESSMVRPPEVLEKALAHVQQRWEQSQDIVYATSQLKSIRQDLTVQGIRDALTVRVYESHARIALVTRQHAEFNQCQNQLRLLYAELGPARSANRREFTAYRILYYIFTKDTMDLAMTLASLSPEDKADPCIKFALSIQSAWLLGNYHQLFALYSNAPQSSAHVMDLFLERERKQALLRILKAYRPTVPLDFLVKELAFTASQDTSESAEDATRNFLVALGAKFADTELRLVNCAQSHTAVATALATAVAT